MHDPLARRTALYILARVIPSLVMLGGIAVLTRTLTPEEYGVYALCISFSMFAYLAGVSWLSSTALRLHSLYDRTRNLPGSVALAFIALLPPVVFASVAGLVAAGVSDGTLIALFVAMLALFAWTEVFSSIAVARMDAQAYSFVQVLRTVLATVLAGLLAWLGYGAVGAVAGTVLGYAALAAWAGARTLAEIRRAGARPTAVREVLAFGLPLGAGYVMAGALGFSERFILAWSADAATVGLYLLARDFADRTLKSVVMPIGQAAVPAINDALEEHGPQQANQRLAQMLVALLAVGLPATTGLALIASDLGDVLVGSEFRVTLAQLLPVAALATLLATIKGSYLDLAFHLARASWSFTGATAVQVAFHLAIALVLIPLFGAWGAVLTLLVSNVVGSVIVVRLGRRVYALPVPLAQLARLAAATVAMAASVLVVQVLAGGLAAPLRLGCEVAAGTLIYGAALIALNVGSARRFALGRLRASWRVAT